MQTAILRLMGIFLLFAYSVKALASEIASSPYDYIQNATANFECVGSFGGAVSELLQTYEGPFMSGALGKEW